MLRWLFLSLIFNTALNVASAYANQPEDYHSFDPFRDKFLEFRDNPPEPLKNNPNPIPKIIHQFWIGNKLLPEPYKPAIESCKNMEGFEHKMWTNAEIEILLNDSEEYKLVFKKIPVHDIAVQKDYLSYLALKKYGGVVADISVLCHQNLRHLHDRYSHYFVYPYATNKVYVNHAYLLPATVIGAVKDSIIINNIIIKFKDFVSNYATYNKQYTSKDFEHKELWHGWVGQILINESAYQYCFAQKNTPCKDIHIISAKQYYPTHPINKDSYENVLFIDTDHVLLAFIIKSLYTGVTNLNDLLGLK